MVYHLQEFRILAEKVFTRIATGLYGILLIVAIDGLFHAFDEQPARVRLEERIPIGAPYYLDDVPARAAEQCLQLLDDFTVASDRAVETLEIAIYYPDQVIQVFSAGERQRSRGFRLIHFSVTDEATNFGLFPGQKPATGQIAGEAGLIDGHNRGQSHGDGWKLPEIREQIRMRVRGKTSYRRELLAKVMQLGRIDAPFYVGPRIGARRCVPLKINHVRQTAVLTTAEKMIKADFVQRCRRGVGRYVSADIRMETVGLHDHRHGVPTNVTLDAAFNLPVAGIRRLLFCRNRINVGSVDGGGNLEPGLSQLFNQFFDEKCRLFRSFVLENILKNGFQRI